MKLTSEEKGGILYLSGALEIYEGQNLCQGLLGALSKREPLTIDLSGVQSCDAAGAQAIWSARQTASGNHIQLRLVRPAPAVLETWQQLGLPADCFEPQPCSQA